MLADGVFVRGFDVIKDDDLPQSDSGFPARAAAQAKANAIDQLEERIGDLWPAARAGGYPERIEGDSNF
jgi:hypothetical protein